MDTVIAMVGKPGEMLPQVFKLRKGCLPVDLSDSGCDYADIMPREGLGSIIYTCVARPRSRTTCIDNFLRKYAKSDNILYLFSDSDNANDLWTDENHEWVRSLFHPAVRAELYRKELAAYNGGDTLDVRGPIPVDDDIDYY